MCDTVYTLWRIIAFILEHDKTRIRKAPDKLFYLLIEVTGFLCYTKD